MEILIIVVTLIIDQLVKNWAQTSLVVNHGGSMPVIKGVFNFTYVQNTGAAFGMLSGIKSIFLFLPPIAALALCIYLIKNYKKTPMFVRWSLALMISGAIGNWIDRLQFGYVRDIFDFSLINFAVFNVADICITVAMILIAFYFLFVEGKESKTKAKEV